MEYRLIKNELSDWAKINETPLGNIFSATQVMDVNDPENCRNYLHIIKRNCDFIHRSNMDWLYVAEARDNKAKIKVQAIRLDEFFSSLLNMIQEFMPEEKPEITYENKSRHTEIRTDGERLELIALKLISNALLHNRSKDKKLCITVEDREDDICISFTDNGVGIPEEYHKKIFDAFTVLQHIPKPVSGHIGLGLTVVSEFLRLIKGSYELESEPGKGSTFRLLLPPGIRIYSKRLAQESLYGGITKRAIGLEFIDLK